MPFLPLLTAANLLLKFGEGFAFGTGYGSGVRFGYNDVYSFFKGAGNQIMGAMGLNDPRGFSDSGIKVAGSRFQEPQNHQNSPIGNFFSPT